MEAAVLRKPGMRPRLPTGLGKRQHEPAGVSHSSHSPCYWEKTAQARASGRGKNPALSHINNQSTGGAYYLANPGESWLTVDNRAPTTFDQPGITITSCPTADGTPRRRHPIA